MQLLDCGLGNSQSVVNACTTLGYEPTRISTPKDIESASCIIFPGQGAFSNVMATLRSMDLVDALTQYIQSGRPFLGICVGFQVLFDYSPELGGTHGLGIYPGMLDEFNPLQSPVPQMGWNNIHCPTPSPMYDSLSIDPYVYFVHSFYLPAFTDPIVNGTADYQSEFVASICDNATWATQFHPEKSGQIGLTILRNFLTRYANTQND